MALSKVVVCRKCGGAIRFIDLQSGKRVPVDAEFKMIYETYPADRYYLPDGRQVEGMEKVSPDRLQTACYRPHFATCVRRIERKRQR